MTNNEAIERIRQKITYTSRLMAERPDERVNVYRQLDIDAFELALAALEYTENMRLYELSSPQ